MERAADSVTVTFSSRQWMPIDGTIDNSVATDARNGDDDLVAIGSRVRRAGWKAMGEAPEKDDLGWPRDPAFPLVISAARDDWRYVLAQCERWDEVEDEVGESADDAEFVAARAAIATALGD